jgi:uncharacterized Zn finger protein
MPLIYYLCECDHFVSKFHRQVKDIPAFVLCAKCGKEAKKQLKAPNSTSVVIVDNGLQSRAVEVNMEVVESIQERSTKDFSKEE